MLFRYTSSAAICKFSLIFAVAAGVASAGHGAGETGGIPRFIKVNSQVYRGGQPSAQGFQYLSKLGVKTVIDLQESGSRADWEKGIVEAGGMKYVNIPMRGMETPSSAGVNKALEILLSGEGGPVFVHCHAGKDRTGMVVACYRVSHDGWKNQQALSEARKIGMSWYQFQLQHYVMGYKAPAEARGPAAIDAAATVLPTVP